MDTLKDWLLDPPWWLLGAVALVVIALAALAVARGQRRLVRVAILSLGVAAVWFGVATAITTPLERAERRTLDLIESYEQADWTRMASLIDEETRFANMLKGPEIAQAAEMTHDNLGSGDIRIMKVQRRRDGDGLVVDVRILSEQESGFARSLVTAWRFTYHKRGEAWRLEHIEPLPTERYDPQALLRYVRVPEGTRRGPGPLRRPPDPERNR